MFDSDSVRVIILVVALIAVGWPLLRWLDRRIERRLALDLERARDYRALRDADLDGDKYDRILRNHRPIPGGVEGEFWCRCGDRWPCAEVALRPEEVERRG